MVEWPDDDDAGDNKEPVPLPDLVRYELRLVWERMCASLRATADESVQPVPWVLRVAMRGWRQVRAGRPGA